MGKVAKTKRKCADGCGAFVYGKNKRCDPCKDRLRLAHSAKCNAEISEQLKEMVAVKTSKPAEKPRYVSPITEAEQRALDRQVNQRLHDLCGYGNSPVRRLTPTEIAAIAPQITPLEQIRATEQTTPWAFRGVYV